MNQTLVQHLREKEQRMKEIRRYLHENPELSFEENEPSQVNIQEKLSLFVLTLMRYR